MNDWKEFFPYVAPVLTAASAWWIANRQESGKTQKLEWDYLQQQRQNLQEYIDLQLEEGQKERDRLTQELIGMRERLAVMEAHMRELERNKNAAINRLKGENERLRIRVTQLTAENSQLKLAR